MTISTKVNSFTILKTKNQFIMLKKKIWHMCTNFCINPHNGKLPRRLAPAQCQNSLAPQLLSNNYWSKTKTSISLNRVYLYDTMCHIFSCLFLFHAALWTFLGKLALVSYLTVMEKTYAITIIEDQLTLDALVSEYSYMFIIFAIFPRSYFLNDPLR